MATEMQSPLPAGARGRGKEPKWGARDRRAGKGRDHECGRVRPDGLASLEYSQEGRVRVHLRRALVPLPHGQGLLNGQPPHLCRWTTDEQPHLQHKRDTRPDSYQGLNARGTFPRRSGNVTNK